MSTSYLWHFNTEIVIAPISGVGLLYIRTEDSITQKFLLDQPILIRPNVQFAILPYDESRLKYYIYSQSPKIITPTASTLTGTGFIPNVNVKTMYTILYQEKNKQFSFRGEKHVFWEFTYVNKGTMICAVDNVSYELKQGQMMFFAPHQFHEQRSDGKAPLSFLTVTLKTTASWPPAGTPSPAIPITCSPVMDTACWDGIKSMERPIISVNTAN